MGVVERILASMFGGNRNLVRETVEVFRENAESAAERGAVIQQGAVEQYGTEFVRPRSGGFDRFMDGVNRLPRPAMALGILGLFVSAMVAPLWFAERMQGIALVPEPLWWLLGVIVSFYFGARHQVKNQDFQSSIVKSVTMLPQVTRNIQTIRTLRAQSPKVADTGEDAELTRVAVAADHNAALNDWKAAQAAVI